jgi:glycosyltransferase involved in cell wall biosynthesis
MMQQDNVNQPLLSIVVITLNEEDNIERCLKSLFQASRGIKTEIILVDSGSSDRTIEIASKFPINIYQFREGWPKSPSAGAYIGVLKSSGKYVYVTDADTAIDEKWFRKAIPFLGESDENVAGVAGYWEQVRCSGNLAYEWQASLDRRTSGDSKGIVGGPILFKGELVRSYNYNPFLPGAADRDIHMRLQAAGYEIIRIPHRLLLHYDQEINAWGQIKKAHCRYGVGTGYALRYALQNKDELLKMYLEAKSSRKAVIIIVWISAIVVGLLLSCLGYRFLLMGSLLVGSLGLVRSIVARHSIRLGFFGFVRDIFWALGVIRGFIKRPIDIENFPTNPRIIRKSNPGVELNVATSECSPIE